MDGIGKVLGQIVTVLAKILAEMVQKNITLREIKDQLDSIEEKVTVEGVPDLDQPIVDAITQQIEDARTSLAEARQKLQNAVTSQN